MNGWFWIRTAALMGGLAVTFGAFAAHGLPAYLAERGVTEESPVSLSRRLDVFDTAASYQMYHALAMLGVGVLMAAIPSAGVWSRTLAGANAAFLVGILLFSGSLYLMAVTGIRWLGAITPLGGVAFLIGWFLLLWAGPAASSALSASSTGD